MAAATALSAGAAFGSVGLNALVGSNMAHVNGSLAVGYLVAFLWLFVAIVLAILNPMSLEFRVHLSALLAVVSVGHGAVATGGLFLLDSRRYTIRPAVFKAADGAMGAGALLNIAFLFNAESGTWLLITGAGMAVAATAAECGKYGVVAVDIITGSRSPDTGRLLQK